MAVRGYKRISYEGRKNIEKMLNAGHSVTEIAEKLGYTYHGIYYELKRCKNCDQYSADRAQADYIKRNADNGRTAILELDKDLARYISKLILEDSLSPDEIIMRLRLENYPDAPTSKTTIYTAIDNGLIPSVTRETLLLKRKKTHMFSNGLIKVPKWICEELDLKDNMSLDIDAVNGQIIIKKTI